jgi:hypothetical protein
MDADFRDGVGVGEADVRPGLARVGRLVDAVAGHDVAANARFAHADVNDVGIRFGDSDGADRRALQLSVGDRRPVGAAVDRFPQTAADRAEVRFARPSFDAGHGDRSAAAIRADAAPPECIGNRGVDSAGGGCCGLRGNALAGHVKVEGRRGGEQDETQPERRAAQRARHIRIPPRTPESNVRAASGREAGTIQEQET